MEKPLNWPLRIIAMAAGIACMWPYAITIQLAGVAIVLALLALTIIQGRSAVPSSGSSSG